MAQDDSIKCLTCKFILHEETEVSQLRKSSLLFLKNLYNLLYFLYYIYIYLESLPIFVFICIYLHLPSMIPLFLTNTLVNS